eukprot:5764841-Pyramimonas_sp.AAC.4
MHRAQPVVVPKLAVAAVAPLDVSDLQCEDADQHPQPGQPLLCQQLPGGRQRRGHLPREARVQATLGRAEELLGQLFPLRCGEAVVAQTNEAPREPPRRAIMPAK